MSAERARAYLGIGEVLAQLQAEFPDVSVSKIRFLENAGLIQPARSPSKYRKFSPGDVERLRYILTAQRDQYLPLRVIKDQLDAGEQDRSERPAGRYPAPAPLTRRELSVLSLAAEGASIAEIAGSLHLSHGTVRNYMAAITRKTGARNRIDAIRISQGQGWL